MSFDPLGEVARLQQRGKNIQPQQPAKQSISHDPLASVVLKQPKIQTTPTPASTATVKPEAKKLNFLQKIMLKIVGGKTASQDALNIDTTAPLPPLDTTSKLQGEAMRQGLGPVSKEFATSNKDVLTNNREAQKQNVLSKNTTKEPKLSDSNNPEEFFKSISNPLTLAQYPFQVGEKGILSLTKLFGGQKALDKTLNDPLFQRFADKYLGMENPQSYQSQFSENAKQFGGVAGTALSLGEVGLDALAVLPAFGWLKGLRGAAKTAAEEVGATKPLRDLTTKTEVGPKAIEPLPAKRTLVPITKKTATPEFIPSGSEVFHPDLGKFTVVDHVMIPDDAGKITRGVILRDSLGTTAEFPIQELAGLRKISKELQLKPITLQQPVELKSQPHDPLAAIVSQQEKQTQNIVLKNKNEIIQGTENTRSRGKQFSAGDVIRSAESDPSFSELLTAKEGGKRVSHAETFAKAEKLGPMPEAEVAAWGNTKPADTVSITRAHATVDSLANEFRDAMAAKDVARAENIRQRLVATHSGYTNMTAEAARATEIQRTFSQIMEKMVGLAKQGEIKTPGQLSRLMQEQAALSKIISQVGDSQIFLGLKTAYQGLVEYSTAAKLSSAFTHVVNMVTNLATFVTHSAEQTLSVGSRVLRGKADIRELTSVFGGTKQLSEALGRDVGWKGSAVKFLKSLKDIALESFGTNEASAAAKGRLNRIDVGKSGEVKSAITGRVGDIIRTPFRFLSVADDMMKSVYRDTMLGSLSYRKAFQEGLKGEALMKRAAEFMASPTDDMLTEIERVAKEMTFQEDPGRVVASMNKLLNALPGGKIIQPFVSTPSNIIQYQMRRSVVGVFSPRNIKAVMAGGVARDEAISRLVVGLLTTAAAAATVMGNKDITGDVPKDAGERDKFYRDGKKAWSIKIGDNYYPFIRFGPSGLYLAQVISFRDAVEQQKTSENSYNLLTAATISFAKSLTNVPFVAGMNTMLDALNDPLRYGDSFINQVAAGLVPLGVRNLRYSIDNRVLKPQNPGQAIMAQIPGLSKNVPAVIDALGQEATMPGSPAERLLAPSFRSPAKNSEIEKLLKEADYTPAPPTQKITWTDNYESKSIKLSNNDFVQYKKDLGRATKDAIQYVLDSGLTDGYSQPEKKAFLQKAISAYRKQVEQQYIEKYQK